MCESVDISCIHILSVSCDRFNVFDGREVQEMCGPVHFVIEILRVGQLQLIVHCSRVSHTYSHIRKRLY